MFCNKTGLWWAVVESELHSESGDLNLATCLAGTGESNNMWQDGKVSAPGRGGSTMQKLSRVITQSNATCQGNLDDFSLPGLLQAKLQGSPFLLGRDKTQSHTVETSDAVCYFQTWTCAWIQTHPAKGQKKAFDKYRLMPLSYFSPTVTSGPPAKLSVGASPAWPEMLQHVATSCTPQDDAELHQEAEFGTCLGPAASGAVLPPDLISWRPQTKKIPSHSPRFPLKRNYYWKPSNC